MSRIRTVHATTEAAVSEPRLELGSELMRSDAAASTRADEAYVRLREEIIATDLPPGTLLLESKLMHRLGVGRTPVREALIRLHRDGFITIIPRRGTLVSEINITDLAAIYEVRTRLESWAARLAAERAQAEDRREAEQLIQQLDTLTDAEGYAPLLALDRRIHRFVYRTSKNEFLAQTLDHYHNLSLRILQVAMRRYPTLTPRLEDVVQEQRTLLEAICRGDGETAERVAAEHVLTFEDELRKLI
jgi:DNA-binding GntR family transcriptional regulator